MSNVPGLDPAIQRVVEAAITSEMSEFGYYGSCEEGFEGYSKATEELPINDHITITYPDGQVHLYGSPADHLEPMFAGVYANARQLFEKWDEEIKQNFERFDDLPFPTSFDSSVERLGVLATALDAGGAYLGGEGAESRSAVGNLDLEGLLSGVAAEINPRQGQAIEALRGSYLDRLPSVIAGQQVLVAGLGVVVHGERTVWEDARTDLLDIAAKAEAAFLLHAGGGGGGGGDGVKDFFTVVGGIVGIVGAFASGPAAGVAGAVIGVVSGFLPDVEQPEPIPFQGGSTNEVHANLLLALSRQCNVISDVERAYADCAEALVTQAGENPDYFDLAVPGTTVPFLETGQEAEYLGPGETVDIHGPELREAAGYLEAVGLILRQVVDDLPALPSWTWERYHIVGYGRFGHHSETSTLREQADSALARTATTLGDVAEKMVLVSYDFETTEDQIEQELGGLLAEIPDPTPGQEVPYGVETIRTV